MNIVDTEKIDSEDLVAQFLTRNNNQIKNSKTYVGGAGAKSSLESLIVDE